MGFNYLRAYTFLDISYANFEINYITAEVRDAERKRKGRNAGGDWPPNWSTSRHEPAADMAPGPGIQRVTNASPLRMGIGQPDGVR